MSTKDLDDPLKLYGWEAIATHGQAEILHVTPAKDPLLRLLRALIFGNSKGPIGPLKITLNKALFRQFLTELGIVDEFEPGTGLNWLCVPFWEHEEETPIILSLPDYGVTE